MRKINKIEVVLGVVKDVTETEVFVDIEVPNNFEELDMQEQYEWLMQYDPQTTMSVLRKVLGYDIEDVIISD